MLSSSSRKVTVVYLLLIFELLPFIKFEDRIFDNVIFL